MKTHNFRFNPNLLAVELPEGKSIVDIRFDENGNRLLPYLDYELLGKLTDLTDDDVKDLVKFDNWSVYRPHFGSVVTEGLRSSRLESFHSLLESEIYWKNPIERPNSRSFSPKELENDNSKYWRLYDKWHEAELRTFDKNRTILFKKV